MWPMDDFPDINVNAGLMRQGKKKRQLCSATAINVRLSICLQAAGTHLLCTAWSDVCANLVLPFLLSFLLSRSTRTLVSSLPLQET